MELKCEKCNTDKWSDNKNSVSFHMVFKDYDKDAIGLAIVESMHRHAEINPEMIDDYHTLCHNCYCELFDKWENKYGDHQDFIFNDYVNQKLNK